MSIDIIYYFTWNEIRALETAFCPLANQSLPKHDLLGLKYDHRKTKTMYVIQKNV